MDKFTEKRFDFSLKKMKKGNKYPVFLIIIQYFISYKRNKQVCFVYFVPKVGGITLANAGILLSLLHCMLKQN